MNNFVERILKEIEKNKKISNVKFLTKGKHSFVYDCNYENKNCILKINLFNNEREVFFLKKLKTFNFVPKLFFYSKDFIIMEKIFGKTIKEFLESKRIKKNTKLKIIEKIFEICQKLDKLQINKMEMTNPYKHVFITKNYSIKFIDFERSKFTNRVKNENQFKQYLKRYEKILNQK